MKIKRIKIPTAIKQALWVKYNGEVFKHKCFVKWCVRIIDCFTFEVGHNKPISKGGDNCIKNLRPICRQCNVSMGNRYTIDKWNKIKI